MASISKIISPLTGKISFQAIVTVKGHKTTKKTFSRKTDASAWASTTEYQLREQPHLTSTEASRRTLGEAINKYLKHELVAPLSANHISGTTTALKWWTEQYGNQTLKQITPALLSDARDRLSERTAIKVIDGVRTEARVKPATVLRSMVAIEGVLKKCQKKWHWIPINPMAGVEKPAASDKRKRFLKDSPEAGQQVSEFNRLMKALEESESTDLRIAALMAINTGGRQQEILGLKWSNIDFKSGTVMFTETKNKSDRGVTLPQPLLAELKERKRTQQRLDTPLVFPNKPKGTNPIVPISLKSSWKTAREKAELHDFRWHDLRHTAASYLAMEGSTLLEIAAVLGHKTIQSTERYSHLSDDVVTKLNTRIHDRIANAGGDV